MIRPGTLPVNRYLGSGTRNMDLKQQDDATPIEHPTKPGWREMDPEHRAVALMKAGDWMLAFGLLRLVLLPVILQASCSGSAVAA
jgi:hypothetical protein